MELLGPFGCLTELGAKRAEIVQKFVPQSRVRIFRYEHTQSTPLDPKLTFLMRFVLFGCIWDCLVALRNSAQNGPNYCKSLCHEVASEFLATNAPDPPPMDPKLTFWCVSYYLGAFGTVWLTFGTRCQTGRTSEKVRATKSRQNFSQRTHPIHLIGT